MLTLRVTIGNSRPETIRNSARCPHAQSELPVATGQNCSQAWSRLFHKLAMSPDSRLEASAYSHTHDRWRCQYAGASKRLPGTYIASGGFAGSMSLTVVYSLD